MYKPFVVCQLTANEELPYVAKQPHSRGLLSRCGDEDFKALHAPSISEVGCCQTFGQWMSWRRFYVRHASP
jgi:hypothetical protein